MRTVNLCGNLVAWTSSAQTSKAGPQDMGTTDADKAFASSVGLWLGWTLILKPNPALMRNRGVKCRAEIDHLDWFPPGSTFWVQILELTPSIMISSTENVTKWGTRRPCSLTDFPGILVCSIIRWVPLVFGVNRWNLIVTRKHSGNVSFQTLVEETVSREIYEDSHSLLRDMLREMSLTVDVGLSFKFKPSESSMSNTSFNVDAGLGYERKTMIKEMSELTNTTVRVTGRTLPL